MRRKNKTTDKKLAETVLVVLPISPVSNFSLFNGVIWSLTITEIIYVSHHKLFLGWLLQILLFQAEISLCRVYKRAGVEDHPSLPRSLPSRASSSRAAAQSGRKAVIHNSMGNLQGFGGQSQQIEVEKMNETDGSSNSDNVTTALGLSKHNSFRDIAISTTLGLPAPMEEEGILMHHQSKQLFTGGASSSSHHHVVDDLHRLVNYPQAASIISQQQHYYNQFSGLPVPPHSQPLALSTLPNVLPTAFSDRLWDWNPIPEANREYTNPFK